MNAFLRRLLTPLAWLRTAFGEFWGWDFFISYAWKDGQDYATRLKKALEQGRPRFDCFLDVFVLDGTEPLDRGIARHLRKSSALVLIGSGGALDPLRPRIETEVRFFVDNHRPIHTIRLGNAPIPQFLAQRPWISEREGAPAPSPAVVLELMNKFKGLRQRERRFRVLMVVLFVIALVVFTLGLGFYFEGQQALALARRLRTAGIVRTAAAARDPLVGSPALERGQGRGAALRGRGRGAPAGPHAHPPRRAPRPHGRSGLRRF
jgi:hypothetical protein